MVIERTLFSLCMTRSRYEEAAGLDTHTREAPPFGHYQFSAS